VENESVRALCADVYDALAEALSEPPAWLAGPGCAWPLFNVAARLASELDCFTNLDALANVPAEPLAARQARYVALFVGTGQPRFWLYESAALTGRLLGPESFAVEKLYRAAGLMPDGTELPDHASLELAFLGELAKQETAEWERGFIEKHAGRWLPQLGRALAASGDAVYAPIGQVLADWLDARSGRRKPVVKRRAAHNGFPVLLSAEACTLCGFCARVCPTRALTVQETDSETRLVLEAAACIQCGKCERICDRRALTLAPATDDEVLRRSPRGQCAGCGQPTVSQAELNFVMTHIGHPAWLDYCPACRSSMEIAA
jgi:ferredoxin